MTKVLTEKQRARRDERIVKLYRKGMSTREIADKTGLGKSRVWEIVA